MATPQPEIAGRALASQLLQTAQSATLAAEAAATAAKEPLASPEPQNPATGLSVGQATQRRP